MLFSSPQHTPSKLSSRYLGHAQVLLCLLAMAPHHALHAGPEGPKSAAGKREIERRDAILLNAETLHTQAALHYEKGEYEEATRLYRQSWLSLPNAPYAAAAKEEARQGFARSAVAHARKLAANADYAGARAVLQAVLSDEIDPNNDDAQKLLSDLDDPEKYEPAATPQHMANVDKVQQLLIQAQSFTNLGDYDSALERYMDILRIDRYNSAARRGMEHVEGLRANYLDTARDHARSKALSAVDQMWEAPEQDLTRLFGGSSIENINTSTGRDSLINKLATLRLPRVMLQDASLEEVIEFLRIRTREVDPQNQGIDFVLKVPVEARNKTISLNLVDIPVQDMLRYVMQNSNTSYRVDDYAVTITSLTELDTTLISRSYRVPPDFIQNAPIDDAAAASNPFAAEPTPGAQKLTIRRLGAKELLAQRGITFPEGAGATYQPGTSMLLVRNTSENLALVETIVDQANAATPKQVEIQVRLIEVNQTRLGELGFDWLMGQFDVPGSSGRVFAGGGTIGNQRGASFTGEDFPFSDPAGNLIGGNPITAGLRSSGALTGVPSIDTLIGRVSTQPVDARSPGAFSVSGVFTDPQFQTVIRALSQSKGIDLLASPTVVTKSGNRTNITVSREMRYPTEFDPPQIPQTLATEIPAGGNTVSSYGGSDFAPITPSTPTAFEMRDVGIVLEVEPLVGPDNRTIELNLVPSSTEFEGFIDYGEDITNTIPGPFGTRLPYNVQNDILQPIFRSNKVNTSVTVWDGQTVVLGGVMMEKVSEINDKVPVIGDVPIIGRAFQSKVKQTEQKNVIFFVTARIIDPAGRRIRAVNDATAAATLPLPGQ